MVAHIGEAFVHNLVKSDPLGRRQRVEVSADVEGHLHLGAPSERLDLVPEDPDEWAVDDA